MYLYTIIVLTMAASKGFFRRFREKTGSSLAVIILAALLLEGFAILENYYARSLLKQELNARAESQLRRSAAFGSQTLLAAEQSMKEQVWTMEYLLDRPDSLFTIMRNFVRNNRVIVGAGMPFAPGYYPSKGRLFQPYAVRNGSDIDVYDLAATGHDYSGNPAFLKSLNEGVAVWTDPYQYGEDSLANLITYAYPIRDKAGRVAAVSGLDIDLSWFGDTLNLHPFYPSSFGLALTEEGRLVAGPSLEHPMRQDLDEVVALINDPTVTRRRVNAVDVFDFRARNSGRKASVHLLSLEELANWQFATVNYEDEVYASARKLRLANLLLILASFLVLLFILRRYILNAKRLTEAEVRDARLGSELQVARSIQEEMLPKTFPPYPERQDLDIYGVLEPAREVGGDLYDFFIRDEKLFFCIGDVSGKGVPSAMVMSVVQALFRTFSERMADPARIVESLNAEASRGNESTMFVTFFLGILDLPTGRLRYCNAGHERPALIRDRAELLDVKANLPIGVFPDTRYEAQECQLAPGTTVFLYTDGLTEAKNERRELFMRQRMLDALSDCTGNIDGKTLLERVSAAVRAFRGKADPSDDLTMLAIRYTPEEKEDTLSETITLKNDIAHVDALGLFVKDITTRLGFATKPAHGLRLAVEEIVVNVMNYAYPDGKEGEVRIDARSDGEELRFIVTDNGIPFDPTEVEMADTTLSVEERPIGGLGIFLARGMADSINYERIDGHNVLTLKKKIETT